jgi:NitT/TauT family transport system ATP-binding protein
MSEPSTTAGTVLSIRGATLKLGGKTILENITEDAKNIIRPDRKQGQVLGLLGPSGIGKTTLFKAMSGVYKLDSGEILIHKRGIENAPNYSQLSEEETLEPARQGHVGVVTQSYRVFKHMTVLDNLVIAGRKAGLTKAEAREKAEALLDRFGILDRKDFWPMSSQISGGQRQRVAILQQLMAGHQIICMDEPVSGLDPNQKKRVIKLIQEVTSVDDWLTIVMVTHDIAAAVAVSDHLWLMGRVDNKGVRTEGARVVSIYDLVGMGLAWHEDVQSMPDFRTLVGQISDRFDTLA